MGDTSARQQRAHMMHRIMLCVFVGALLALSVAHEFEQDDVVPEMVEYGGTGPAYHAARRLRRHEQLLQMQKVAKKASKKKASKKKAPKKVAPKAKHANSAKKGESSQ